MRIAIIGAGAIGGLVAGYLKLKGGDITLIGHKESISKINSRGLDISGVRGEFNARIEAHQRLAYQPDLVILATKTQDIEKAVKDNLEFIRNSLILTTQNGAQADNIASNQLPEKNITSSIVMFGATCLEPGKVIHNFEGPWIIGKINGKNDENTPKIKDALKDAFDITITNEIRGMKYLKIFVNANNCIAAILGCSMQEAFGDTDISRISIEIWKEGLRVMEEAGIKLVDLPDFTVERIKRLTSMPIEQSAKVFSGIMKNLSDEPLYGSIFQSIKRGKPSEIDYINGEFPKLGKAPLNKKLTELVHQVEKTRKFLSKEELLTVVKS
ncbi:MAG: hypothetical protein COV72_04195 [Candidatus Omnitrophica bacterium CG11_big_fil_rev_8_21_14_0_20_42_13]|uniref:2-dehydropantoate 2-reductase n=1 Tax=Candidatus Ghiorseimicrobium undicola TaxID=1974746 RepID=A0A2H0LXT6_9BACT|nr:MAG: hypothetical protein COV72_04195 [Candidatus Omnitrophica bacterium CG11_big_fil_rev_8_21_14_0_20_42_13]